MTAPKRLIRSLLATALLALVAGALCSAAAAATTPPPPGSFGPVGAYTTQGAHSYLSAPNLFPPRIRTDIPTEPKRLAPGYFMVANFKNLLSTAPLVGQGGPLILDRKLSPVWFHPVGINVHALNLSTQVYDGRPALSWWEGVLTNTGVVLSGTVVVVDQHYQKVATVQGADGWVISVHEALIRGHDMWVTSYRNKPMNLAPYGGPANGVLVDSAVQEYDLHTGKLVYSWDVGDPGHVSPSESEVHPPPVSPWDAYHVNAIDLTGDGKMVVSMRNTWGAYLVDIKTGKIQWRLGGKNSSFKLGAGAAFEWQHDVRLHPGGVVSLFDDACCAIVGPGKFGPPVGPSRGLLLKLDGTAHTATLVAQYAHNGIATATQGDAQLLPNGNMLVGFGSQPWFAEYSKAGDELFDARMPDPDITYRAYVQNWVGLPLTPPSGAARNHGRSSTVYASWNGATRLARWIVEGGRDGRHLAPVASRARAGFETAIALKHRYRSYRLLALDARGRVIGRSKAFKAGRAKAQAFPPAGY